jgi:AcrR family transcriptional regulator
MTVPRHQRHVEHGYACGEETRARIIAAAVKLFGEHGFEGASTRDIAAAAGVNAPALQYYFDNKEGVYLACVEHIAARVWEHLQAPVTAAQEVLARQAGDAELIEAYCAIQDSKAELMFKVRDADADDWRLFMARQQTGAGPPAGFQRFQELLNGRMSGVTAGIVARLLGKRAIDDEVLIRTMALGGQLLVFQMMRRSALTALGWDKLDEQRLTLIKDVIRGQTVALLRSVAAATRVRRAGGRRARASGARRRVRDSSRA